MPRTAETQLEPILGLLRIFLHVAFAAMLGLGLVRITIEHSLGGYSIGLGWLLAAVLATVYFAGTFLEHRKAKGELKNTYRFLNQGNVYLWLFVVVTLWALLVILHPDFSWIAFPLFFLELHVMRRHPWAAYSFVALTGAAVVCAPLLHGEELTSSQFVGPLIGAVAAVILWHIYQALFRQTQAQSRALEELHRTRDELARSQRAAGRLAERERIARDIHDTLAQGFSSVVLCSRAAQRTDQETEKEHMLQVIEDTAAQNLHQARSLIEELSLADASIEDFLSEMKRHCQNVTAMPTGSTCRLVVDGEPRELDHRLQELLLRVTQASLANVVQHAAADNCVVTLGSHPDAITLDIYDDGVGIHPATSHGFGLTGVKQRVKEAGGEFFLESGRGEGGPRKSGTGKGTVVGIRVPIGSKPLGSRP